MAKPTPFPFASTGGTNGLVAPFNDEIRGAGVLVDAPVEAGAQVVPEGAPAGAGRHNDGGGEGMTASFPRSTLHNVVGSDESGEWKSGQVEI
ncbi:hypothetical protein ColTof3_06155 [Colletotrichum tofieldiae]|nr:hypothetical protein ColTof3_06155 [Colletotrichum tofieldiae]